MKERNYKYLVRQDRPSCSTRFFNHQKQRGAFTNVTLYDAGEQNTRLFLLLLHSRVYWIFFHTAGLVVASKIIRVEDVAEVFLFLFVFSSTTKSLQLLDLEAWRQRLLQLLGLLLVLDHERVEEPGAADLELGAVGVLLDLNALGILPPGFQKKVLKSKIQNV